MPVFASHLQALILAYKEASWRKNELFFLQTGSRSFEILRIIIHTGQTLKFVKTRSLNEKKSLQNLDIHHTKNGHNSSQRAV
ncbi:hypothetical protein Y032_0029g1916 [Ancylostoma ceylanicum]|uniref:Uncharacterized protein n=1 Tax=Ancylostoma ceylanicum TaxID=53326 RepID=A0A016UTP5_9BILA|nr:hypothetical protein Y032_0029g1916 [Ancylostoma ceylanicum]